MLHSSAFDDHHAIPTTAEITRSAHRTASLGARIFPSTGLSLYQLAEAIKDNKLAPVVLAGDSPTVIPGPLGKRAFTRAVFASSCAAFIRSGYPVLLGGYLESAGAHAVCAVGFRESPSTLLAKSAVELADAYVEHVYIHDDNLGPSVKFRIHEDASNRVLLKADPPPPRFGLRPCEPTLKYPAFYPTEIIAAVHEDLRMSPGILHRRGMEVATGMHLVIAKVLTARGAKPLPGFWLSSRFIKLAEYLRDDLTKVVKSNRDLGRVRLSLMENVPPMSLHLGVVRLSLAGAIPIVDLLFDTTDSDRDPLVFAHVVFANEAERIVAALATSQSLNLGKAVIAY